MLIIIIYIQLYNNRINIDFDDDSNVKIINLFILNKLITNKLY